MTKVNSRGLTSQKRCWPGVRTPPFRQRPDPRPPRAQIAWLLLPALALPVAAEGFRNPTIGTFGLGRSGGRIAHVDDASAVQHNPANLTDLQAPELAYEQGFVYASVDYTSPQGATAETREPWKFLPAAFAAWPLAESRWALGLGVTSPFGLSTEWPEDGYFRYLAPHFAELITLNVNPSVAWRVRDNLSLGAGLDVMWSQLSLEQAYPWGLVIGNPAAPDGLLEAKGDGVGVSGNFGVTWEFVPGHRLAAVCRAPMDVDYSGTFRASEIPAALAPLIPAVSDFDSTVAFPTMVQVGYGVRLGDAWRIEADAEWIEFSRFASLPIKAGATLPGVATSVPQNWDDTFTAGIAAGWQFHRDWNLRFGYQYFQSPIPDETYSPTIPDADQNVLTVGLSWRRGHHGLAVAYGAVLYDERNIRNNVNPAFNGDYEITVHLISASYRYSF